ncbi:endolytic transglycosylase MltG [Candidatus Parcubacteria bacterium]|nr:endolytic transglycosylase MltG [Candidatus Parcubacteria bacterium]
MKKKKLFLAFIIFVFSLVFIVAESYFYIQNVIENPYNIKDSKKREFIIQNGESVEQIAINLESDGLIAGKDFFKIYVWEKKIASDLQAGSYELSPSMTITRMADLFIGGKIKGNDIWVTIPEGFSSEEIDERLTESGLINKGEFINFDNNIPQDFLDKYEFLKDAPADKNLQGYYFPDTYKYYNNSSIEEIASKMLNNFDLKLTDDLRAEIKGQDKTISEVIILASIIEKEAGNSEDMKKVSSVFTNRLEVGKALESDATINYVTKTGRARSTYEDLEIESPYNTYKYVGLTPSPIANPGIEAIKAAINPEETDYFYFLTKEDGEAVFSITFKEHLKNKYKYLGP